jgi:RNA polymerase sigma-B factor
MPARHADDFRLAMLRLPPSQRDRFLFQRYRDRRDPRVREELARRYLPLANRLARRSHSGREPLQDLQQVAALGLIKALERFDPDREVPFAAFATVTISGELKRHYRDATWPVHVPRALKDRVLLTQRAFSDRSQTVTLEELAAATGLTAQETAEAEQAARARQPASLEARAEALGAAAESGVDDHGYALVEDRATLATLTRRLHRRDRQMLRLRFTYGMTQAAIGQRLGLSQMHVSRLMSQTLETLRLQAGISR